MTCWSKRSTWPGASRRGQGKASLRRALSAAYYALFHLLAAEGAGLLARARPAGLRAQVRRAFVHADMKSVCRQFAGRTTLAEHLRALIDLPVEPGLASMAAAFLELQDARHAADYDMNQTFTRLGVFEMLGIVHSAFDDWPRVRDTPNAAVFLTALLLNRQWGRS